MTAVATPLRLEPILELVHAGYRTLDELAAELGLDRFTTAGYVGLLRSLGLVTFDPHDGRIEPVAE